MDRKREFPVDFKDEPDNSTASSAPPKRAREIIKEYMQIPNHLVGWVIGCSGANVHSIYNQTGCQVRIDNQQTENGWKMCCIEGLPGQVPIAKKLIETTMASAVPMKPDSVNNVTVDGVKEGVIKEYMQIPNHLVGWVIGSAGVKVHSIFKETGCKVQIDKQQTKNDWKMCSIEGLSGQVPIAKKLIETTMASADRIKPDSVNNVTVDADNSTASSAPPKRAKEIIKEYMQIPNHLVGWVIGGAGANLYSIYNQTGCKVQIDKQQTNNGWKTCRIEGLSDQVPIAKKLIETTMASADQMKSGSVKNVTVDFMIPAHACGMIIGKDGAHMRKLRALSSCSINLIQDSNRFTDEPKPLRITGQPAAVKNVVDMVKTFIANCHLPKNGHESTETTAITVKVPRCTVGAIIGQRGTNIVKIATETGCKIQFLEADDARLCERSIAIVGHPNCVTMAVDIIREIVNRNNHEGGNTIFCMTIPSSKCGLVIGRGGESIRQINAESGAHCELSRDPSIPVAEKMFVIRGSEMAVEHAKHLICIRLGDISPMTPFRFIPKPKHVEQPAYQQPYQSSYQWTPSPSPSPAPTPALIPYSNPIPNPNPPEKTDYSAEWLQYYLAAAITGTLPAAHGV